MYSWSDLVGSIWLMLKNDTCASLKTFGLTLVVMRCQFGFQECLSIANEHTSLSTNTIIIANNFVLLLHLLLILHIWIDLDSKWMNL